MSLSLIVIIFSVFSLISSLLMYAYVFVRIFEFTRSSKEMESTRFDVQEKFIKYDSKLNELEESTSKIVRGVNEVADNLEQYKETKRDEFNKIRSTIAGLSRAKKKAEEETDSDTDSDTSDNDSSDDLPNYEQLDLFSQQPQQQPDLRQSSTWRAGRNRLRLKGV